MCITMPPPPPVFVPRPTSPPAPPAPAPLPPVTVTPGVPPGPTPPSVVMDVPNSMVYGVGTSFSKILKDNGLVIVAAGGGGSLRIVTVLQNLGGTVATSNFQVSTNYSNIGVYPLESQQVNVPANGFVSVETYLNVPFDGAFQVTITIGTTSIVLPISFYGLYP